ncbi:MAG: hypothetical protein HQK89_05715 [Nitrospirae bacterium]|nr:hypothetical protein [Nitrospirota bacterium]
MATLPFEVFEVFEDKLGKEDARVIVKSFETTITGNIENKWASTKNELLDEIRKEITEMEKRIDTKLDLMDKKFATKTDLQLNLQLLESKMKLYFLITIFAIILTNSHAMDLIAKLLGFVK